MGGPKKKARAMGLERTLKMALLRSFRISSYWLWASTIEGTLIKKGGNFRSQPR